MVEANKAMAGSGLVLVTITDSHGMVVFNETVREGEADTIIEKFLRTIR
jgi:hypothetical protein